MTKFSIVKISSKILDFLPVIVDINDSKHLEVKHHKLDKQTPKTTQLLNFAKENHVFKMKNEKHIKNNDDMMLLLYSERFFYTKKN